MNCQSSLDDPSALIIIDASVVINLNASGLCTELLSTLPNKFTVAEEVKLELENGRRNGHNDADALNRLIHQDMIEVIRLGEDAQNHFLSMISGPTAESLDDGEAATIACALERNACPVIDEKKAIKICEARFGSLTKACTIDLFFHEMAFKTFGQSGIADAVFNALTRGRMRVLEHHQDAVIRLIGSERAAQCSSLPSQVRLLSR